MRSGTNLRPLHKNKIMTSLKIYITRFLLGYGYSTPLDFFHSLCPSFKYHIQTGTLTVSGIFALISHYIGFSPLIVFAMLVAVIVETLTGIKASMKRGEKFESFRFSRCIIKVSIWMVLVFITNCFMLECENEEGWLALLGSNFFDIVRLLILVYFLVEYIVSIMENLAVLDGKPKSEFVETLRDIYKAFARMITKKVEEQ